MRWWGVVIPVTAAFLLSESAAYHPLKSFTDSVNVGGGGGQYFTGSPRNKGYDCSICHTGAPGRIAFSMFSTPAELLETLTYEPGQTYEIVVHLDGETRKHRTNVNTFVFEFLTDTSTPAGEVTGDDLQPAQHAPGVFAGRALQDVTRWAFEFTAPGRGTGRVSLHLAGVDGDGAGPTGDTNAVLFTDAAGDDVFVGAWRICEAGTDCDRTFDDPRRAFDSPAKGSCAANHRRGDPVATGLALLVFGLLAVLRRTPLYKRPNIGRGSRRANLDSHPRVGDRGLLDAQE